MHPPRVRGIPSLMIDWDATHACVGDNLAPPGPLTTSHILDVLFDLDGVSTLVGHGPLTTSHAHPLTTSWG